MTTTSKRRRTAYVGVGSTSAPPRRQVDPELLAALAARLTGRDRWLLELLHEHRVLTTAHIRQLAFGHISAATHRMLTLWRLRAVERFRPAVPAGSAPWHYVLGPAGAIILAERRHLTAAQFGYRLDQALAVAHSDKLPHLVGTNELFTALTAHARSHPGAALEVWWSEQRCHQAWGKIVRPDGYGRWREDDQRIDFFVEYDTGTEPLHRLLAKIADYQALAEMTGLTHTPVLFALPNPAREQHLHTRTTPTTPGGPSGPGGPGGAVVATTTPQALRTAGSPAGPAWHPLPTTPPTTGHPHQDRRRLINLTTPEGTTGGTG
ncbi:replication-relaxation family protein [Actinomadura sp. SCN-SB]|uniref:replication-relaxation family protein n=1 Tax=Actinomadura sp. SCN-SB TaxID=3373092 RepID=UPI003752BD09